ncbi:MAG TPA: hypothetical protein VFA99_01475 [Acidobacteriaceae bacterium]|nr:hypothetical protein [Acidobacteriaceae bacterium]
MGGFSPEGDDAAVEETAEDLLLVFAFGEFLLDEGGGFRVEVAAGGLEELGPMTIMLRAFIRGSRG